MSFNRIIVLTLQILCSFCRSRNISAWPWKISLRNSTCVPRLECVFSVRLLCVTMCWIGEITSNRYCLALLLPFSRRLLCLDIGVRSFNVGCRSLFGNMSRICNFLFVNEECFLVIQECINRVVALEQMGKTPKPPISLIANYLSGCEVNL